MLGFKLVSIQVENEGGVVVWSVLHPETGSALIATAEFQCRGMEAIHGGAAGGDEGQMESGAGRCHGAGLLNEQQSVVFRSRQAVADGVWPGKDSGIPKRGHAGIVEGRGPLKIADAEREMAEQCDLLPFVTVT
jgi:hypothetical protein